MRCASHARQVQWLHGDLLQNTRLNNSELLVQVVDILTGLQITLHPYPQQVCMELNSQGCLTEMIGLTYNVRPMDHRSSGMCLSHCPSL